MALFGFGKKKPPEPEPKKEQSTVSSSINQFSISSKYSPEDLYKMITNPSAGSSAKVTIKTGSGKIWSESIDAFLARNPDAKLVKLTGKPEDLADYQVCNRCSIEQDDEDDEKYNVLVGDCIIGRLPSSAITYAEKHDVSPEFLVCIIAEVEYDIEKERDIISVYIAG